MTRRRTEASGRRLRWLVPLLLVLGWLLVSGATGSFQGKLGDVVTNDGAAYLPAKAESVHADTLQAQFSDNKTYPAVVVYERASGITTADHQAVGSDAAAAAKLVGLRGQISPVTLSKDGRALQFTVPLVNQMDPVTAAVKTLRATAGSHPGLTGHVAGLGGMFADFSGAFSSIDGQLLVVAVGLVILVLLLVYRSPTLPLLVLLGIAFASGVAAAVVYGLAKHGGLTLTGQSQGVLSVLVVGATTDYSLLLVSRYQEELRRTQNKYEALATAWRAVLKPVLASGGTVILGTLCLLFSNLNSNRSMGPVAAIGIAASLLAALTFVPAVLALMGRGAFWPFRPAFGTAERTGEGLWGRIAGLVGRRPRGIWIAAGLLLVLAAGFATQFKADGVSVAENFTKKPDSVHGQQVLNAHFAGGSGAPVTIIARAAAAEQVATAARGVPGITSVTRLPKEIGGYTELDAVLATTPDAPAAVDAVKQLRDAVHAVPGSESKVGGFTATSIDTRVGGVRDFKVVVPLVLIAILIVLALLLRALVAPLLLIATVVLSYAASMGVAALMFNHVFHFANADPSVPLMGFVFLVAFGVDYNIFLMHRVREEALLHGTRNGTLFALRRTGGVITSAGVVLAATFAALAVVPMVAMAEQAFIVAFGVLLDTIVVRSLLVPALTLELGDRAWWPSKAVFGAPVPAPRAGRTEPEREPQPAG
ncbi:MMPL family transporter [Streptomyces sp. H10-C2]|uniref:MMPL family transporter n=1 Tax=unclassified Streptomyces TaxID=2593676 RepID=UPI0024BB47AB|nr:MULTISPECIES: MMPL family transporter [unclassified Streptomyces]MDJ0346009.1 MMPL family transporter [Streptomyces sp. PH10-H1]MDJ0370484.1 MMPL family transporter [Streptomyces sp. H10-C2]